MKKLKFCFAIVLSGILILTTQSCKKELPTTSGAKVFKGDAVGLDEFPSSGYLGTANDGCSGVALCEYVVVTAAHCASVAQLPGAFFTLAAEDVNSMFNNNYSYIAKIDADDASRASTDVALLVLTDPIMKAGFRQPLLRDFNSLPLPGDVLSLVGYGYDSPDRKNWQVKRRGFVEVTGDRGKALTWQEGESGQIGTHGDSGGGLFNSRGELVAIESHVGDTSPYVSSGSKLIFWQPWVDKVINKYCPAN